MLTMNKPASLRSPHKIGKDAVPRPSLAQITEHNLSRMSSFPILFKPQGTMQTASIFEPDERRIKKGISPKPTA